MEPTSPYDPPQVETGKKKGLGRLFLIGCGSVLLLFVLGIGTCALVVKQGMAAGERDFGPPAERYFSAVDTGDYARAYAEFGEPMRASMSEENYVALEKGIHERTGKLQTKKMQAVQAGTGPKGRWGRIIYSCEFEKGPATVRIELDEEGSEWKVIGFNYDSPAIEESIRSAFRKQGADADGG